MHTLGRKRISVSKPAAIAGEEVVTGFVGGHAGNYIEEALKPFEFKVSFTIWKQSRSCINIWDETNRVQTEFLEPGFTATEEQFQDFKEIPQSGKTGRCDSNVRSVPKDWMEAYQRLVEICREEKRNVILDTSGALLTMGIKANRQ